MAPFYIDNIEAVRGKKRLDLNEDPAPDLVIEIDVTSSSQNRALSDEEMRRRNR